MEIPLIVQTFDQLLRERLMHILAAPDATTLEDIQAYIEGLQRLLLTDMVTQHIFLDGARKGTHLAKQIGAVDRQAHRSKTAHGRTCQEVLFPFGWQAGK